ncbi:UNKNOWN [Stylonychia lemnae]|uniref:N-acetyltransferase domain-containing protein n=1 Tax=Stylonychia lemnae TaxID=5949 RepID=A0A078AUG8_STYLE|nr:UNKNOWN [Stylonychia lemnae]|eukprot:CDW84513.1 UNKNOWN [Stylonychia lemnae]
MQREISTLEKIEIRKFRSVEELDEAMIMRCNELKNHSGFKNLEYDIEIFAGRNVFTNGDAWGAFNLKGEAVALTLAFDLMFEPYESSNSQQKRNKNSILKRQWARKFLNSKPGEYCYVGYAVARNDYRRLNLVTQIIQNIKDDLTKNSSFNHLIGIGVSREGFLCLKNFGFKILQFQGAQGEDDKNEYYNGGEMKKGMAFSVLQIYNLDKKKESNYDAKL